MRVARALFARVEAGDADAGPGGVTGSRQGLWIRRKPDRVLSPDVAFTFRTRRPKVPSRGYFPCASDLAGDVRSPEQSLVTTTE